MDDNFKIRLSQAGYFGNTLSKKDDFHKFSSSFRDHGIEAPSSPVGGQLRTEDWGFSWRMETKQVQMPNPPRPVPFLLLLLLLLLNPTNSILAIPLKCTRE